MTLRVETFEGQVVFACHHGDGRSNDAVTLFSRLGFGASSYPGGMRDMVHQTPREILKILSEGNLVLIHDELRNAAELDRTFYEVCALLRRSEIPHDVSSMDELIHLVPSLIQGA